MSLIENIISLIGDFISSFWWVFILVFLLFIFFDIRRVYKNQKKKREIEWSLLRIIPPKEVKKSPKAMEQLFVSVDEISDGWASFEIVGRAGKTNFYIRIPKDYRNLIESAIYAQYPDAEINLVPDEEDYVSQFSSSTLPNEVYDIWGTELILGREDGYPIRTYLNFQESGRQDEEQIIDPIASITEIMSRLERSEAIWLQILVKPADNKKWIKEAEELIKKLMGGEEKKEGTIIFDWINPWVHAVGEFIENLMWAIFRHPMWGEEGEQKKKEEGKKDLTPGKRKIIDAIEEKISKVGFHTVIRFVYVDRRDMFTKSNIAGVMGAIRQFNTNHLNFFTENKKAKTKTGGLFKDKRLESRKKWIFSNYTVRDFPKKSSILNTEELATIYHFPTTGVKSPFLRRVLSKRGGPPPDLPIQ